MEDASSNVVEENLEISGSRTKRTCTIGSSLTSKRNYSKYQRVCLLCAKSQNLQAKKRSVLSRSSEYHIKRHINSSHPKILLAEVKANIVPIDHSSVPKSIREKISGPVEESVIPVVVIQVNKVRTPAPEVRLKNDMLRSIYDGNGSEDSNDGEVESSKSTQSMGSTTTSNLVTFGSAITTKAPTLQTDLANFVTIQKPAFEKTAVSMLKKLDNKLDNLKEGRSTTAGNSENHYGL